MIRVIQPGMAGTGRLLFDMHRLRAKVFHQKMKWNVHVDASGLEVDEYDLPDTVYLVSLNSDGRVNGSWRLMPTLERSMIREVWPQFLTSLEVPRDRCIWEVSRFAVDPVNTDPRAAIVESNKAVADLFCGLTEICITFGITDIFTLYDARIERVLRRLRCKPSQISSKLMIDDYPCQIASFKTDGWMLNQLRETTGTRESVIQQDTFPRSLMQFIEYDKEIANA